MPRETIGIYQLDVVESEHKYSLKLNFNFVLFVFLGAK